VSARRIARGIAAMWVFTATITLVLIVAAVQRRPL
jgi:hypothetical protein